MRNTPTMPKERFRMQEDDSHDQNLITIETCNQIYTHRVRLVPSYVQLKTMLTHMSWLLIS